MISFDSTNEFYSVYFNDIMSILIHTKNKRIFKTFEIIKKRWTKCVAISCKKILDKCYLLCDRGMWPNMT